MTANQANTSIYLTEKVKARLKILAAKRNVHISTLIREAIDQYLTK